MLKCLKEREVSLNLEAKIGRPVSASSPLIYLITKGDLTPENFAFQSEHTIQIIRFATAQKIPLIQIREKLLTAKLLVKLASDAVKIAKNTETKIIINDRVDIALAAYADGVHLPASAVLPAVARRLLKRSFICGRSTHSIREAEVMKDEGADFITFSPVFETPSKAEFGPPQGLEKLREVCERLKGFPVIALGGINNENFQSSLDCGAKGFAAIRFLNERKNLV